MSGSNGRTPAVFNACYVDDDKEDTQHISRSVFRQVEREAESG